MNDIVTCLKNLQNQIHQNAVAHGWWGGFERNEAEAICLMHSELSEALENIREGKTPDHHLPEFKGIEVELADCIIRILDFAEGQEYRVIEALMAKHAYNLTRPYKHGNKKF